MINIPKGTKDVLPNQSYKWQYVENCAREVAALYNLKEIRTPAFEYTELFTRGVGETTDVVTKEMYTFEDKGGRSITLKPEGTAGAVRLFIENGLYSTPMPLKTYYITPAFRYERPQAGRLREFHQFGIEVFGSPEPETDAEVIFTASDFLDRLGLKVRLELNSIGCPECRARYNKALKDYYRPNLEKMCPTCQTRFEKNPLRMLDCKEEECKKINENAPEILDYLCDDCKAHFEKVKEYLAAQGVQFTVNPRIVRGLDYYTRTVFEFVSDSIGAQGTVCGGGRYDNLFAQLGEKPLPAIGFAAGIERLLLLMESSGAYFPVEPAPEIFIAGMGNTRGYALNTAMKLRRLGINAETDLMNRSVKAQLKYADKVGAKFVVVLGDSEIESGRVSVKNMADGGSAEVEISALGEYIRNFYKN